MVTADGTPGGLTWECTGFITGVETAKGLLYHADTEHMTIELGDNTLLTTQTAIDTATTGADDARQQQVEIEERLGYARARRSTVWQYHDGRRVAYQTMRDLLI